jgi:hypothetical protein
MPKFIKVLTIKDEVLEKGYDVFSSMENFLDFKAEEIYRDCFEIKVLPGVYAKFFEYKDKMHDIIEDIQNKFNPSGCGNVFKKMAILIVFTSSIPEEAYDAIDVKNIQIMCRHLLCNYADYECSIHMELFNERIKNGQN